MQDHAGGGNDTLIGGDADDQAFGQADDDRMVRNPGDDTDLNEGAAGFDTIEVHGANGTEQFTATANGARVRFDRLTPAPFSIDIGTTENLVVDMNGGDDRFTATGKLAGLIKLTVDGGVGKDTILGSNGNDVLLGGDGNDFIDGNQGNDVARLGAGDDTFQWDPGDSNDTVEGQDGPPVRQAAPSVASAAAVTLSAMAAPTRATSRRGARRTTTDRVAGTSPMPRRRQSATLCACLALLVCRAA